MGEADRKRQGEVAEKTRPKTVEPQLYKVLLHNDDYTTMEFVVSILESVFVKSPAEAYRVMMHVHIRGIGIAGVYPYEVAETKVSMVHDRAREAGHPLRCSMEPD
ncbi:MAG: ATP-dependent Clp protease adaptor ClpS [Vicinamibacteria bacterium]